MTTDLPRPSPARRLGWRYFVQFSLRSLLVFMTLAAVGCWWFLQPAVREEALPGGSTLRLERQVRLVPLEPMAFPTNTNTEEIVIENQRPYKVVNAGRWRLFDFSHSLLVDGRYKNGKQHGKWITYHANGRKAVEGVMADGQKVGVWRTWDVEGKLLESR